MEIFKIITFANCLIFDVLTFLELIFSSITDHIIRSVNTFSFCYTV